MRSRLPTSIDLRTLDVVLAAALTALGEAGTWLGEEPAAHRLTAALLVPAFTVPLAVRRGYPTVVGAGVPLLGALQVALGVDLQPAVLPIAYFCALYALAAWTSTPRFAAGLGLLFAADLAVGFRDPKGLVFTLSVAAGTVLVRVVLRSRERRAELAERERDLAAREAVLAERARVARELHDSLAHHVSLMVVQAGAERRALNGSPGSAPATLRSIEELGRAALVETRRVLGLLRGERPT
jgi:signal transduction histidine kinase